MGLSNREHTTYVNVLDGQISIRAKEGAPGAIKRENKNGKIVWEMRYDQIEGFLVGFSHRTNPYKSVDFLIDLEDGGRRYQLQVPWSSSHTKEFLNCCYSINLKKPVTFRPYKFKPDDQPDKVKSGWTIHQSDMRLPRRYTKDSKEKMPDMVKTKFKGVEQWDDTDQMEFLWGKAYSWASNAGLFNTLPEQPSEPAGESQDYPDDLPPDFS
jgi:hypothetical protein